MNTPRALLAVVFAASALGLTGCNSSAKSDDQVVINARQAKAEEPGRRYEYRVVRMDDVAPKNPIAMQRLDEARTAARKELEPQGWEYVGTEISVIPDKPTLLLFRKPVN